MDDDGPFLEPLRRESCSVAESVTDSSLEVTETALEASTVGLFLERKDEVAGRG